MTASASGKGPDAFRTISEASAELGVPAHMLRFWETKFAFVRPMKRAGGRRFYRPQDLDVLRGVRTLLQEEGYTIKGVQRLHKEGGVRRLVAASGVQGDAAEALVREVEAGADEPPASPSDDTDDLFGQEQGQPVDGEVLVGPDAVEPGEVLAAAARPAPPSARTSRHVLDGAARKRLGAVLNDLETVKASIDRLLRDAADS